MSRNRFISLATGVLLDRIGPRRLRNNGCAPSPIQLGCTRVGHLKLSKSDISDFDGERVGVRGYGLSLGCNPSPGLHRTMLRIAEAIRPLPMGEVKDKINSSARRRWCAA